MTWALARRWLLLLGDWLSAGGRPKRHEPSDWPSCPGHPSRDCAVLQRHSVSLVCFLMTYTVNAVVTTSKGNALSLWSHIQGEPVE
jgi:hypothetical protein